MTPTDAVFVRHVADRIVVARPKPDSDGLAAELQDLAAYFDPSVRDRILGIDLDTGWNAVATALRVIAGEAEEAA